MIFAVWHLGLPGFGSGLLCVAEDGRTACFASAPEPLFYLFVAAGLTISAHTAKFLRFTHAKSH